MSNHVVIKNVFAKNLFRFGENGFKVSFENGLTIVTGENGLGKSTILDALSIALFNSSYRKLNKADWVNNINKKGLFVSVEIDVVSGTNVSNYVVINEPKAKEEVLRRRIVKDGVLLDHIADIQNYIENSILGFTENIFTNSIAVSSNTPFISMTPDEKRVYTENLFSITEIRKFKKTANEYLSTISTNNLIISNDINSIKNKIGIIEQNNKNLEDVINNYNPVNANVIDSLNQQIADIDSNIALQKQEEEKLNLIINELIPKINEKTALFNSKSQNYNEEYSKLSSIERQRENELNDAKTRYRVVKSNIAKIVPNVPCYACGNAYTEASAAEHIAEHQKQLGIIGNEGREKHLLHANAKQDLENLINTLGVEVKKEEEEIKTLHSELSNYQYKLKSVQNDLNKSSYMRNNCVNNLNAVYEKIKNENKENETIKNASESIKNNNAEIEKLKNDISSKEKSLVENNQYIEAAKYIISMCSDDGIRAMLLKRFVPKFNELIKYYLHSFNLPLMVEFDESFKHTINSNPGIGNKHSSLSKGQRRRIDIAILFAMVNMIQDIGKLNCNLLILDEFADDGLDVNGFNETISLIKEICTRDNKAITVITFKSEKINNDCIDYSYNVVLEGEFSKIQKNMEN